MIINEKYKFVFQHIPKCGGMMIRTFLLSIDGSKHYDDDDYQNRWHFRFLDLPKDIQEKYTLLFNIRHPIGQAVSMYNEKNFGNKTFDLVKNNKIMYSNNKNLFSHSSKQGLENRNLDFLSWYNKWNKSDIDETYGFFRQ